MENNQLTVEETKQFIIDSIEHYEDFEEYSSYNSNTTLEEFEDYQERGFINEITCGVYNGATDTFTPSELNENNLINTITQDLDFKMLEGYTEGARIIDYVLAYVEIYQVFTIGDKVYVDLG